MESSISIVPFGDHSITTTEIGLQNFNFWVPVQSPDHHSSIGLVGWNALEPLPTLVKQVDASISWRTRLRCVEARGPLISRKIAVRGVRIGEVRTPGGTIEMLTLVNVCTASVWAGKILTLKCFLFLIRISHGFPSKPIWQTQWWLPSVLIQSVFAPHCFPPSEHSSMSRQPEPNWIRGALDNKHDSYQNIFYGLCSLSYIHTLGPWCRRHCWHSSCGCHNTQIRPIVGLHSRNCHTIPICPMVEKKW